MLFRSVGRVVVFEENTDEKYFCNNFTSILRPTEIINYKFSLYLLKDLYNRRRVLRYQNKTTGIINIRINEYIQGTEVSIPNKEVQQKIAEVLDKAQELIDKRKAQIEALDELIKSIFYGMFSGEQKKENLENLCYPITKGTTPSPKNIFRTEFKDAIPFLKVYNIKDDGSIDFEYKPSFISRITNESTLKRSIVYHNDVLMNIVGPPLCKIGIVPKTFDKWNVNQAIAIFRVKENLNPIYLLYCLKSDEITNYILSLAIGIRQQNISLKQCRELEIKVPPMVLQNRFAIAVGNIEKQKELLQQSLAELENNFNNLMQNAFKGKLFN